MSKSKPWRVEVHTAGEIPVVDDYRSQKQRDTRTAEVCNAMRAGETDAYRVVIREWDTSFGRYCLYDTIDRTDVTPRSTLPKP